MYGCCVTFYGPERLNESHVGPYEFLRLQCFKLFYGYWSSESRHVMTVATNDGAQKKKLGCKVAHHGNAALLLDEKS